MKLNNIFIITAVVLLSVFIVIYFSLFFASERSTEKKFTGPIAIGILTSDEKVIAQYKAFAEYLSKYSGRKWRLVQMKDSGSFIEQLENHEIQSAIVGSAAGYRIIKENLAVPVVRGEKNGISNYYSYIFTRKDSRIDSIEGLKDKRFAYVDINTPAGYLYPVYLLKSAGHDPEAFFRAASFLGTHEKAIEAVLSGNFDGGAAKDSAWRSLSEEDPSVESDLQVIAKGGPFPEQSFVISSEFSDQKKQIEVLLTAMTDTDEGRSYLEKIGIDRFVRTDTEDFKEVEKMITD